MKRLPVINLLGPTAAGKTDIAIQLAETLPCDIISVDSAMIYRGMDIGTAKPDAETLARAPHRLINICDPIENYSVAQFCDDALTEIKNIHENNRIPLLVGGTMMYFHALLNGLAKLPDADEDIRKDIFAKAETIGWQGLHDELTKVDPQAAARIHPNDQQRIQRALEVFYVGGKPLTELQHQTQSLLNNYQVFSFAIVPDEREKLHENIEKRLEIMWQQGFVEEVKCLHARGDLDLQKPAMRAVGYRQVWQYLEGGFDQEEMQQRALFATRQLAKRQLTWLRNWDDVACYTNADELVERLCVALRATDVTPQPNLPPQVGGRDKKGTEHTLGEGTRKELSIP